MPAASAAAETHPASSSPSSAGATEQLPSVVSTNLCADLLLLRLGRPEQILSVSHQAQDPVVSPVTERAAGYPANQGAVEELLYYGPDIALTYLGWSGRPHSDLLARQGVQTVPLPYPQDLDDALEMTRSLAQTIGRAAAGERAAARATARIAALSSQPRPYRTLYLRPNGGTAGRDTYIDAMIQLLGLRNLAAEQGIRGWGQMPLEQVIAEPPDLILLGYFDKAQPPSQSRFARHPLLADLLARVPTIGMPSDSAWGCGGLELIDAAEHIAARLERLEPASSPGPNR
ncbi:MAG: ABC transporter substrate-binding protein [Gammaproteobacteria bacterium]|nr:ABC transporter substrate-binding protein [Gammaproteobacteria bacterium]